jgi:hypothetical protein
MRLSNALSCDAMTLCHFFLLLSVVPLYSRFASPRLLLLLLQFTYKLNAVDGALNASVG